MGLLVHFELAVLDCLHLVISVCHCTLLEERGGLPGIIWQHTDGVLRLPTQHAQHCVLLIIVHHREGILMPGYDVVTVFTHMIIGDYLLSILILCGLVADQHKVPLVTVGTAQVVHQVGAILQTCVPPVGVLFLHTTITHFTPFQKASNIHSKTGSNL